MKKVRGFTLVELVITLAVAGVLAAIALPSFVSQVASWRLSSATNDLVSAVHLARSEAVRLNRPVRLCRATSNTVTNCVGAGNAQWQHWIIDNGEVVRRDSPANVSNLVVTSSFNADRLIFQASGLAEASGTFTLCSTAYASENIRVISVGVGSHVSIERQSGACS